MKKVIWYFCFLASTMSVPTYAASGHARRLVSTSLSMLPSLPEVPARAIEDPPLFPLLKVKRDKAAQEAAFFAQSVRRSDTRSRFILAASGMFNAVGMGSILYPDTIPLTFDPHHFLITSGLALTYFTLERLDSERLLAKYRECEYQVHRFDEILKRVYGQQD